MISFNHVILYLFAISLVFTGMVYENTNAQSLMVDHHCCQLAQIPDNWIDSAKTNLYIAYGHTSHGSQLITGMNGLVNWKGDKYAWNDGGLNGALDIDDQGIAGASDLGNPDRVSWANATRNYLNNPANSHVNVIIWSWCGQVSSATEEDINTYLNLMTDLENDFPEVKFVYMTGHLDGGGEQGNLHQRNEQIRDYCRGNGKILYDFADIESYDPDGNAYLAKRANDNCDYDSDGDGIRDKNWAIDWQNSHVEGVDWYSCSAAHSQALNGNLKAYAAWWLWSCLAGWEFTVDINHNYRQIPRQCILYQNYPNPFNLTTTISFYLPEAKEVSLKIYNLLGREIVTLVSLRLTAGTYTYQWDAERFASGVYIYQIVGEGFIHIRKMILLR
jgi:hypothetical protein